MTRRTRTMLITGAAVAALVASGGVAYAVSAPTTTTAATQPSAPTKAKHHRALLGRVSHGELTLGGKDHRVVDVQRGQVQSVSSTSVSVKSDDGFTATYTVDAKTKIRKDGKASAVGDVHNGDTVVIVATKANGADTANRIGDRTK